jgi:hypothetical protein
MGLAVAASFVVSAVFGGCNGSLLDANRAGTRADASVDATVTPVEATVTPGDEGAASLDASQSPADAFSDLPVSDTQDGGDQDGGDASEPPGCGPTCSHCEGGAPLCARASDAGTYECVASCPSWAPTLCLGACVDDQNDSRNCGACAHDCLAGACTAGQCQPGVLASGGSPDVIAVDATNVYWTSAGTVTVCAVGGCNGQATAITGFGAQGAFAGGIALAPGVVYYISGGNGGPGGPGYFGSCVVDDPRRPTHCLTRQRLDSTGANYGYMSAVTASTAGVFWMSTTGLSPLEQTSVRACGLVHCEGGVELASVGRPVGAFALAADSTSVYWVDATYNYDAGLIAKCAAGGCNLQSTVLASGQNTPQGIAVDASKVYWTGQDGVFACATSGCAQPSKIASGAALGIAVDSANVYWTSSSGVFKCAVTGCAQPTMIASGAARGIAVNSAGVFWTTSTSVMELAK